MSLPYPLTSGYLRLLFGLLLILLCVPDSHGTSALWKKKWGGYRVLTCGLANIGIIPVKCTLKLVRICM